MGHSEDEMRMLWTKWTPYDWSTFVSEWRERKGFSTPHSLITEEERDAMLGKLMLVVTEVSEAAEAVRNADSENFQEEIADVFIRLFDICGSMGIYIEQDIKDKMEKNLGRPQRHGRHTSL